MRREKLTPLEFRRLCSQRRRTSGFTLVEMLIVLAIIGIMAALVISQIANAAYETRNAVGRQQQVVIQGAINNWISFQSSTKSVGQIRDEYNAAGTSKAKLALVSPYLDKATYDHFLSQSSDSQIKSDAMVRISKYINLPDWAAGDVPEAQYLP